MTEMDRETNVFMAKCAEQAERYDEMVDYMKSVAKLNVELSVEERNLLSVAYKNIIGTRRASWRVISAIEQQTQNDPDRLKLIVEYRVTIEKELKDICNDIISILDEHLLEHTKTDESKVFHYKLKGDYYRYLAEFTVESEKENASEKAHEAYQAAEKCAEKLPTTHPIRLGLALNYSVFFYEIKSDPQEACKLAKKAFEDAIEELDSLTEEDYKDSTLIMQLLKDNLTLWTQEDQNDLDDAEDDEV